MSQMEVRQMKINIFRLFVFILTFLTWWNLGFGAEEKPDYWPTNGWRTASPESQGVDSNFLEKMMETIWEKQIGINSVLIIRNGYIVLEANGYAYGSDDTRNIYSCTKSVSSALIGIAIDKGFIKDVRQPVLEFFTDRTAKNLDADKKAMTLEHLLTMTAGLECRDSYLYQWAGLKRMQCHRDWVKYMIDLPMAEKPGTCFEYCNGASFLLSAILQKQTGMNALSFAEKNLFGPLGISKVSWPSNPQGITIGYAQLRMRPRDMAKVGHLYLNKGLWDGKQIISSQWVKRSTRKHITATLLSGYGYQWWIISPGIYAAVGHEGQFIMIAPEKNMLAVFTSSLILKDFYIPLGLLAAYILPSAKSPTPLPENPDGENSVRTLITRWETTSPLDRGKMRNKTKKPSQRIQMEAYVNNVYGFSLKYDAELLNMYSQLVPPLVVRRTGLKGLPVFMALVDDIPGQMALKNTGNYLIDLARKTLPLKDFKIRKQELFKLSDGTNANYVEINWRYHSLERLTVGVFAYKKNKIIGAVAVGMEGTPIEYLAGMVKSLRFKQ
jgi:CubicO group peptidase (beta-lactamase class C family)